MKKLSLIACILLIGCSMSGSSSSSISPAPVSAQALTIDPAGDIPLPNGQNVSTVIFIHNNTNQTINNISYQVINQDGGSSDPLNLDTTACSSIVANNSCAIPLTTPSISSIRHASSAAIQVSFGSLSISQVINWYYYPITNSNTLNFSNKSPDINSNGYITEYLIADAAPQTIFNNISVSQSPGNVLQLTQGISSGMEMSGGQVVAVEFKSNLLTNVPTPVNVTPNYSVTNTSGSGSPVSVKIVPVSMANIVVGNTSILTPSQTSQTITIVNNGNQTGTVTTSLTGSTAFTSNNNCSNTTITSGNNCSFTYSVASNNSSESGNIVYNLTSGGTWTLTSPLLYIDPYNIPVITVTPSVTNLAFAVNESANVSFTIQNVGTESLNNFSVSNNSSGNSSFVSQTNTCSSLSSLLANASCTVSGYIQAGSSSGNSTIQEKASGTFNGLNYNSAGYTYVQVFNQPVLTFTPSNTATMPSIKGDGVDSATTSFTITNTVVNSYPATIQSESYTLPSNNTQSITADTCTAGTVLSYNESCGITFKSGPTTDITVNESGIYDYTVNYSSTSSQYTYDYSSTGSVSYEVIAQDTSLSIESVISSGNFSGSGTSGSPYVLNSYESTSTVSYIQIIYQNTSNNYSMNNLSISTASLSPLYTVDGASTCGYGTNTTTLAAQATCVLQLDLNRASIYASNPQPVNNENIVFPNASWQQSGGTNTVTQTNMVYNSSNTVYVNYINTVLTTMASTTTPSSQGSLTFTQTITNSPSYSFTANISSLSTFNNPTISVVSPCTNSSGVVSCSYGGSNPATESVTYQFSVPLSFLPLSEAISFTASGLSNQATVGFSPYYIFESMSAAWRNVGTAGFSAGTVTNTSLAINSSGTQYVGFLDAANGNAVTVMKYNGSSWVLVGIAGFSAGSASNVSLAINSSGTPYVAYTDNPNQNRVTVMQFNGTNWATVGTAGFTNGSAAGTSLAINSSGIPYVAYADGTNGGKATVMEFSGGNWESVGTGGFSAANASFTSLAINSSGTPYVAYADGSVSNKATVMEFSGGNWESVGTTGFSAGITSYTSLAINSSGTLYVAYEDGSNSSKATVMTFNGTSWVTVGTTGFSAGTAQYTSLAINSSGIPYVAYEDGGNSNKAAVMEFNGTSWVTVGNAGFSAGAAPFTSLAIESNGVPYVAYRDGGNSNKATVMDYQ